MFDANFMAPFAEALDSVIQMIQFPPNGVFDEEHVAGEQGALHRATLEAFRPIHELIQARKHKKREIKWLAVTDAVRRYVYGNSMRDVIPSYIVVSIQNLKDLRWKNVFTQLIIVKHNDLTVSRAIEGKRSSIPHLMDLERKILSEHVPKDPHPPEFFNKITVPRLQWKCRRRMRQKHPEEAYVLSYQRKCETESTQGNRSVQEV